jgi:hypothetical protein
MARWLSGCLVAAFLTVAAPAWGQAFGPDPSPNPFEPTPELAPEAPPPPHVDVGIGENTPSLFEDPRFTVTGIHHVRLTVPYDIVKVGGMQLNAADAWLRSARDHSLETLVTFSFSLRRGHRWRWHLPSVREYRARLREFRAKFPWVREYSTWNEANHKRVQPSGKHPVRTAALYRELRRQCDDGSCRALAADVLLTNSRRTWRWIRTFRRHAGPGPHTWGIHNYPDANRHTRRFTRRFLRTVQGEVWFTETGGIVHFGRRWSRNERRAARAIRWVFRLARLSPRITRVYLYNWRANRRNRRWDSGLISPAGRARGGYLSLIKALGDERFSPLPRTPPSLTVPAPPEAQPGF